LGERSAAIGWDLRVGKCSDPGDGKGSDMIRQKSSIVIYYVEK